MSTVGNMPTPPPPGLLPLDGNLLACPLCGDTDGTHVDTVYVSARQEDHNPQEIHVHAVTGQITHESVSAPTGPAVGEGRRHRIALTGWCEMCGREYAIIFTQHKGQTYVETVEVNEGPVYDTGKR